MGQITHEDLNPKLSKEIKDSSSLSKSNETKVDSLTQLPVQLSNHISDTQNPHKVTAQQTGAATKQEFDVHVNTIANKNKLGHFMPDDITIAVDPNTGVARSVVTGVPIGVIVMWSGEIADIPDGWALCDGKSNTPNLTDRFIVGAGAKYTVKAVGGNESVTLSTANMPSHSHGSGSLSNNTTGDHTHKITPSVGYLTNKGTGAEQALGYYNGTSTNTDSAGSHTHTISGSTASSGSGLAHENRPPFYALAYIMKL